MVLQLGSFEQYASELRSESSISYKKEIRNSALLVIISLVMAFVFACLSVSMNAFSYGALASLLPFGIGIGLLTNYLEKEEEEQRHTPLA